MSLASLFTHRHSIRRHIGRLAMSTSPAPMPPHATNTTSRPQPATTTTSPTQPATNTTSLPPMTPAPSTSLSPPPTSNSPSSPPATHYLPPPQSLPMGVIVGIVIGGVWITLVIILGPLYFYFKKKKRTDLPVYDCPPPGVPKDDPYDLQPQHWQPNTPQPGSHAVKIPPMPSPPHAAMSWPPPSPGLPPTIRPPSPPLMSSNRDSGSNYTGGENPLTPPSPGVALGFSKRRFTYEELAKATDNFSKANFLGQGGFGFVHKGILLNGKEVAIKKRKEGSDQGEREFQVEVDIISRVHHRHVVTLVGYCISGSHRMLVYEFVPNKTLEFHLHGKGSTNMDWPTRRKSALGAAKGLAYLHEDCHPKIIHRDIKAANILMDSNFEAKVADFGLAKECPSNAGTHIFTEPKGTYGYLAPEYALSGILTDKADVYAFGVMLLELITGRRPLFSSPSSTMVSLAYWATPLLKRALKNGNFDGLVDPRLQNEYNHNEMVRMVTCAACCVKTSAQHRPQMSQVVLALEGHLSLSDLNAEILGDSSASISHGSSDYDTNSGRTTLGHDGTNL